MHICTFVEVELSSWLWSYWILYLTIVACGGAFGRCWVRENDRKSGSNGWRSCFVFVGT